MVDALERHGHRTLASTRRVDTLGETRIFLDFESDQPFVVPPGVDYVFIVAAATNYGRGETNPTPVRINLECIPRFVEQVLDQGIFVAFLSTNSVFGGELPWPHEDEPHAPRIAYAKHKSDGEERITSSAERLGALDRLAVIRLTKVLGHQTPPLPTWFDAWHRSEVVTPFVDFFFAPMSVRFVGEALATIGEKRACGSMHLSGAENLSYFDFAKALGEQIGINPDLIAATTTTDANVDTPFKLRFSGLSMERTTKLTNLKPQPVRDVVRDLIETGNMNSQKDVQ